MTSYAEAVCRGSWALGTACGKCARCRDTKPPYTGAPDNPPSGGSSGFKDKDKTPPPLSDGEALSLANLLMTLRNPMVLTFDYTNYRGEKSMRRVIPEKAWHGSTEWHPEQCLLLTAYDIDKAAHRDFKFTDIDLASMKADRL